MGGSKIAEVHTVCSHAWEKIISLILFKIPQIFSIVLINECSVAVKTRRVYM